MPQNHPLDYFCYLDKLSKLGVTNMRKAGVYLEGRFMLEHGEAEEILDAWFAGFSPPADSDPQLVQLLSN
jgi:hypothetical protein